MQTFSPHKMATLQIGLFWCVVSFLAWHSEGHSAKNCFELKRVYLKDRELDWESVQRRVTLYLTCEDVPNGVISLTREFHSIPLRQDNLCSGCEPSEAVADHSCVCCNDTGIELCKASFAPKKAMHDSCKGKRKCQLEMERRGLGNICSNQIDYSCVIRPSGKEIRRCGSRWVRVTYECVQGDSNSSTTVSSIVRQSSPEFLTTGTTVLVVAVSFLLVVIAVIIAIFCWRHQRLKKKYYRERRLVSSEGSDREDAKQEDASVYYKAGPIEDTANITHQSTGIRGTDQNGNGLEKPLLDGVGSSKDRKHDYENIKDVPNQQYTQVDKDLTKKNRSSNIDKSNVWHDPQKDSTGAWKGGQGKAISDSGQMKGGHEAVELIDNVYYEGESVDQGDSNAENKKEERRQKSMDTDYEEL